MGRLRRNPQEGPHSVKFLATGKTIPAAAPAGEEGCGSGRDAIFRQGKKKEGRTQKGGWQNRAKKKKASIGMSPPTEKVRGREGN